MMLLIKLTLFPGSLSARSEVQVIRPRYFNIKIIEERHNSICIRDCAAVEQSVQRLATGWTTEGLEFESR
jgi:hypothetical protein